MDNIPETGTDVEERYQDIDSNFIAARITAVSLDKPTSGPIKVIKFQSTPNVWGYFSVGANGGIHDLFAKGPNRESTGKALVALKEMEVRGDIRDSVEYLVQLLETDHFKQNTIDTSWLDGNIKDKSIAIEMQSHADLRAKLVEPETGFIELADISVDNMHAMIDVRQPWFFLLFYARPMILSCLT